MRSSVETGSFWCHNLEKFLSTKVKLLRRTHKAALSVLFSRYLQMTYLSSFQISKPFNLFFDIIHWFQRNFAYSLHSVYGLNRYQKTMSPTSNFKKAKVWIIKPAKWSRVDLTISVQSPSYSLNSFIANFTIRHIIFSLSDESAPKPFSSKFFWLSFE